MISQCMLCHRSLVCCEIALRINVGGFCVCSYSLPSGTVIRRVLLFGFSWCFELAVIVVVEELPLSPFLVSC